MTVQAGHGGCAHRERHAGTRGGSPLHAALRLALQSPAHFSRVFLPHRALRPYQATPANAIAHAVLELGGNPRVPAEFAAVFARQSGKDEMLAQLLAYLLVTFHRAGGTAVVALPTLRPQAQIARDRLLDVLASDRIRALGLPLHVSETQVRIGRAAVRFPSAAPTASARGQTASLLLVANEAQDIEPDRWDSVFAPMTASTAAPTLFMGTTWSSDTLLARQMRYLRELEASDGHQRLFLVPWQQVAEHLPPYAEHVQRQIAQLGPDHPFIRTEYELEELASAGRLFPASRQLLMRGDHPPLLAPLPGETYALTLDVAGEEELPPLTGGYRGDFPPLTGGLRGHPPVDGGIEGGHPLGRRDSTALTVFRVLTSGERPTYQVVRRYLWTGTKHTLLHQQVATIARTWRAHALVVDATGVGAGLASFLQATLPPLTGGLRGVLPFTFSLASKSQLGWDFLGLVDAGRYQDHRTEGDGVDAEAAHLARLFWQQVEACTYEVRPGPGKLMSWAVPDPRTHDDLLVSAALAAALDQFDWRPRTAKGWIDHDHR